MLPKYCETIKAFYFLQKLTHMFNSLQNVIIMLIFICIFLISNI